MIGFHYPYAFFFYAAFAGVAALFAWSRWRRRRDLARIGDWRLVSALVPVDGLIRRQRKDALNLAALAVLILAATGPQFGTRLKEVKQRGVDVFVALDTSRSMMAEDVPPSRLERAKQSLGLLVDKLGGNRIGIIAFARRAVLQCPLTIDSDAARMFLDTVNENTVPEQGTGIGAAIRLALSRFPKGARTGRAIVLLTDGEDHNSDPVGAAREAKEQGVVIFTIGIGTTKGEVIKDRDTSGAVTGFHKFKGEMVVSHMDDALLTKISEMTGGAYYRASSSDREIDEIAEALNGFEKRELTTKVVDRLQERYVWFALAAFLLLVLEFFFAETPGQWERVRAGLPSTNGKSSVPVAAALLLLALALPARADVRDHVREGNKLFRNKDIDGAIKEFESAQNDDPDNPLIAFNIATMKYAGGHPEEALKDYERADALARDRRLKAMIAYNAGHALFTLGRNAEAAEKFKQSLRLDPRDVDAKYNLEYIKAGKKPPPNQSKTGGSPPPSGAPSPQAPKKGEGQQKPEKSPGGDQQKQEPERKPGELSKEDAERILQMTKDQESEKLKERPVRPLAEREDKHQASGEDW